MATLGDHMRIAFLSLLMIPLALGCGDTNKGDEDWGDEDDATDDWGGTTAGGTGGGTGGCTGGCGATGYGQGGCRWCGMYGLYGC